MCGALLMALWGVALGVVAFHAIAWLAPLLMRALPALLGSAMTASMVYALRYLAFPS